jgi:DNA polymerase-1
MGSFAGWYGSRTSPPTFVGHNALSFDIPTINRLLGLTIPLDGVCDTLVLSQLYDPNIRGGHSLAAWGERLKNPKIEFEDWSQLSEEMITYCIQDVELGVEVYAKLTARMRERGFSETSCWIEHQIRRIIDVQEQNGWLFDIEGAEKLVLFLQKELDELEVPIRTLFPAVRVEKGRFKKRAKADGTPTALFLRYMGEDIEILDDGGFVVYEQKEFNIGSPKQRVEKLLSLGWEPENFTEKGFPKVDEDSVNAFAQKSGRPEVAAIANWLVRTGRQNMIKTWLANVNRKDSRMHGRVMSCGASTRRMTHSSPNTANIPKAKPKIYLGKECRGLWVCPENRLVVGADAAGLEMRVFGHYLNNTEAAALYVEGDPHQVNADNLGISRDLAKNTFYAFLYGAANVKLGETADPTLTSKRAKSALGKKCREILLETTPGLKKLVDQISAEQATGFLLTIDGGYVRCPSPHAALNYKCQSAGAIIMKVGSIILDRTIIKKEYDTLKIGDIHDEWQFECEPRQAHDFGADCVDSIRKAGEFLKLRLPLDGEYKVGRSWAETH